MIFSDSVVSASFLSYHFSHRKWKVQTFIKGNELNLHFIVPYNHVNISKLIQWNSLTVTIQRTTLVLFGYNLIWTYFAQRIRKKCHLWTFSECDLINWLENGMEKSISTHLWGYIKCISTSKYVFACTQILFDIRYLIEWFM